MQLLLEPMGQADVASLAWGWRGEQCAVVAGQSVAPGGESVANGVPVHYAAAAAIEWEPVAPVPTASERRELALVLVAMSNACRRLAARLAAAPLQQGFTLVSFSAQLEPCLTHKNSLHTLNTP